MTTIHQLCIGYLANEESINLESAKFRYKRMNSGKRLKLQRRVRKCLQTGVNND